MQETTQVDTPPDPDILIKGDNVQQTVDIDNPKICIKVEVEVHRDGNTYDDNGNGDGIDTLDA